jgi:hypothetical protein
MVDILWTLGHEKKSSRDFSTRAPARALWIRLSRVASLDPLRALRTISRVPLTQFFSSSTVAADLHRFQESIGGRSYLIEVAPVTQNRWRAYIVRIPGVPTALMPFYGPTPADAARLLREWLARAHQQAASPRPV